MLAPNLSLDFNFAMQCAESLTTIGEREYWTDGAIVQNAKDLVRWCKGCVLDGHIWSAENQAEWLVNEVRERWDKWLGTKALKQVFTEKFFPAPAPVAAYTTPDAPRCGVCADTGWAIATGRNGYEYAVPCCSCPVGDSRRPPQEKVDTEAMRRDLASKVQSLPAPKRPN